MLRFGTSGIPRSSTRPATDELLRALKDSRVSGWLVSESPVQEDDALLLQRAYRRMR